MTQRDLNRSVARVTGEDVNTIEARGFSVVDPAEPFYDDELPAIDWDALELRRIGMFPDRQQRCAVA